MSGVGEKAKQGDDVEVVRLVLQGNVAEYRLLVERYQGKLLCFVRNLVHDVAEAEDLAQEAFLIAYTHLGRFDPERGRFSAWLFTIARNRCLNHIEKKRPILKTELDGEWLEAPGGGDVDAEVARREALRCLDEALDALPIEQRIVFVLAEIMEFTLAEVAEIEGLKVGTVKSRVSRAKAKLKQAILEQRSVLDATGS